MISVPCASITSQERCVEVGEGSARNNNFQDISPGVCSGVSIQNEVLSTTRDLDSDDDEDYICDDSDSVQEDESDCYSTPICINYDHTSDEPSKILNANTEDSSTEETSLVYLRDEHRDPRAVCPPFFTSAMTMTSSPSTLGDHFFPDDQQSRGANAHASGQRAGDRQRQTTRSREIQQCVTGLSCRNRTSDGGVMGRRGRGWTTAALTHWTKWKSGSWIGVHERWCLDDQQYCFPAGKDPGSIETTDRLTDALLSQIT
ncbi:hypothetical protein EVAR_15956_1 [Eumeta japonica]|uniref:Uncharacterized protein n=1 Tax=Eumeta variegata TaxID=151549 RepID=A0A4C1UL31_EUMVA|nr:hypothetical protein EVAR_15956_1 [Eumeta japonica]